MRVSLPSAADTVRQRQEAFYIAAEAMRFEWLTEHPLIRHAERALLGRLSGFDRVRSLLEIGCGEGANLAVLRALGISCRYTGFDCFAAKVAFCRERHPDGQFLVADARRPFPFANGSYDRVLVRDLLHHLSAPDRAHVLHECMRVLAPGGTLSIVEGNASNIVNLGFAMAFQHERCMLETRAPRLQQFVAETLGGDHEISETMAEASNLFRLLFHYRFGMPALGTAPFVSAVTATWESLSRRWRPPTRWAYSIVEVRKRPGPRPDRPS